MGVYGSCCWVWMGCGYSWCGCLGKCGLVCCVLISLNFLVMYCIVWCGVWCLNGCV